MESRAFRLWAVGGALVLVLLAASAARFTIPGLREATRAPARASQTEHRLALGRLLKTKSSRVSSLTRGGVTIVAPVSRELPAWPVPRDVAPPAPPGASTGLDVTESGGHGRLGPGSRS